MPSGYVLSPQEQTSSNQCEEQLPRARVPSPTLKSRGLLAKEVNQMPGMNDALSYIILGGFAFAIIIWALFFAG